MYFVSFSDRFKIIKMINALFICILLQFKRKKERKKTGCFMSAKYPTLSKSWMFLQMLVSEELCKGRWSRSSGQDGTMTT